MFHAYVLQAVMFVVDVVGWFTVTVALLTAELHPPSPTATMPYVVVNVG